MRAQPVAAVARQLAQALALGAQHQRHAVRPVARPRCASAASPSRPSTRTAELLQLGERAGQVLHQRHGHVLERARGRLGQRAVERRAVAARHDEAGGAEHGGRAQDGADVVRVGDLVEHDQRPAARRAPARSASVGSGSGSVSSSAPWCTVSGPSRRSRSSGSTRSWRHAPAGQGLLQPALGVVGQIELARWRGCGLRSAASTAWMP